MENDSDNQIEEDITLNTSNSNKSVQKKQGKSSNKFHDNSSVTSTSSRS